MSETTYFDVSLNVLEWQPFPFFGIHFHVSEFLRINKRSLTRIGVEPYRGPSVKSLALGDGAFSKRRSWQNNNNKHQNAMKYVRTHVNKIIFS